jgi:formylglycine-generating enzyme required for sulfatase activity
MKKWKRALRAFSPAAFAVIVGFVFTGCNDGSGENSAIAVTGVTLNEKTLELKVDETATLTATVAPQKATDKTVTWKSSDDTKATVTVDAATGVATVTAKAVGTGIIITVTAKNGKKATCEVTVKPAVPVTGVTLVPTSLELEVGIEAALTATVLPETANQTVTWVSSAPAVVSVAPDATDSRKAKVKALAEGTGPVTITVTTVGKMANGQSDTDTCVVTVGMPGIPGMVLIKPGTFTMGSPAGEYARNSNETQHQVTLTQGFYMGEYPVTQAQYKEVTGKNPSYFDFTDPYFAGDPDYEDFIEVAGDFPVEMVTWYDAVDFCNKLSVKEGLTPAYTITGNQMKKDDYGNDHIVGATVTIDWSADGYRLPTEAEWEYACRAGTSTTFNTGNNITTDQANYDWGYPYNAPEDYYAFYWGMTLPVWWFDDNTGGRNAWGLSGMHGNVAEWCWDWYKDDITSGTTDPKGPDTGDNGNPYFDNMKITRGGHWDDMAEDLRSAWRSTLCEPGLAEDWWSGDFFPAAFYDTGFRIVRPYSASAPTGPGARAVIGRGGIAQPKAKILPQGIRVFYKDSASPVRRPEGVRREALRRKAALGE